MNSLCHEWNLKIPLPILLVVFCAMRDDEAEAVLAEARQVKLMMYDSQ